MEKTIFQIPVQTFKRYKFYKKSQYWSKEQIEKYQDEQLKKLIIHVSENVPYYRNLFKKIGFNAYTFRGREDMHKMPTLEKETVRTNHKALIADNAQKFGISSDSTSGSTGTPLHFILSTAVQANKLAALLRSFGWAGYKIGKRTFSMQSYYFRDSAIQFNRFYNILRFDSNKLDKKNIINTINEINKLKPVFFMGFPFDILILGKIAEQEGLKIHSPKSILTYGETLSDEKRKQLTKLFRCKVYNFFSMHECAAMISECEKGKLHLIEDFAYHEIIEEAGTQRLIGTSFYNYSMPLIRYEIRDNIIVRDENTTCKCGRDFRIIDKILGKQCDYIQTPDGRFLGAVMSHSIDNAKGVIASQCIQNSIDQIDVKLIIDNNYNKNSKLLLERGLRKRLGNEMKLNFIIVNELEKLPSGKTPFIISKIGHKYI